MATGQTGTVHATPEKTSGRTHTKRRRILYSRGYMSDTDVRRYVLTTIMSPAATPSHPLAFATPNNWNANSGGITVSRRILTFLLIVWLFGCVVSAAFATSHWLTDVQLSTF